jgi:hypothetical protein
VNSNRTQIIEAFAQIPEVQMIIQGESEQGTTVFVLCPMPKFNRKVWNQLIGVQMKLMDQEIWDNLLFLPIELVEQSAGEVWFHRHQSAVQGGDNHE